MIPYSIAIAMLPLECSLFFFPPEERLTLFVKWKEEQEEKLRTLRWWKFMERKVARDFLCYYEHRVKHLESVVGPRLRLVKGEKP